MTEQAKTVLKFKANDDWQLDERPNCTVFSNVRLAEVTLVLGGTDRYGPNVTVSLMGMEQQRTSQTWMQFYLDKLSQFDVLLSALETARREFKEANDAWLNRQASSEG